MRDRSTPLTSADIELLSWEKVGGLMPAVVQHRSTGEVLMLAYMDKEAVAATLSTRFATFFSRSRQRLWQKGETSGNGLRVHGIFADCDADALLVIADPEGPVCHLGSPSCFEAPLAGAGWLGILSEIIAERATSGEDSSYTRRLLEEGQARIAQKVGEEGVELALAAVSRDTDDCVEETADLLYHVAVLMRARGFGWDDVVAKLRGRHSKPSK